MASFKIIALSVDMGNGNNMFDILCDKGEAGYEI
jgi:hypothetical protein